MNLRASETLGKVGNRLGGLGLCFDSAGEDGSNIAGETSPQLVLSLMAFIIDSVVWNERGFGVSSRSVFSVLLRVIW